MNFLNLKPILPRTLFGRSLLIIITPVLLLQIFAIFIFFDQHWSKMTQKLSFALSGEIAIFVERIESDPNNTKMHDKISDLALNHLNIFVSYLPDYELNEPQEFVGWRQQFVASRISESLKEKIEHDFIIEVGKSEKWFNIFIELKEGVLRVSVPEYRLFTSASYIFILWMIGLSFVLFAIAVIFMRNQIRPIRRLAIAADWFGRGKDFPNFKPEGAREVRQAAASFIGMRERIKRQISQRIEMLAGVSHDLRTPITRLKLQLAMQEGLPEIAQMEEDIKDMEKMIDGYLDFARGEGLEQSQKLNIKEQLEHICTSTRHEDVNLVFDEEDKKKADISAMIKAQSFARAFKNLIGNSARFADTVYIRIKKISAENHILIMIDDDGPGIPPESYEDVFKPFFRLEPSRNQKTGGVGLGLSIAMDIIHSHGGQIWLEKSPEGGLRVVSRLPY